MSVSSITGTPDAVTEQTARARHTKLRSLRRTILVHSIQVVIVAAFLAGWQWIPEIHGAAHVSPVFDHFFVSSPLRQARTLYRLATGAHNTPTIWTPFERSVVPALIGTAIAIITGGLSGLICSNWDMLNRIARPFVLLGNSVPRITLIPIFIVIAGPTSTTDIMIGFLSVFFLVFFNAYEGGVSVPPEALENIRILGASRNQELRRVRFPYVLVWTFASLPVAIGFGLTAIVTAELFTGSNGLGQLLLISVQTANADLTIAVTIVLAITGVVLIGLASLLKKRVLHWW
jgi:NitT/TauT family transport system permease protein